MSLSSRVAPAPAREYGWLESIEDWSKNYVVCLNAGRKGVKVGKNQKASGGIICKHH